MKKSRRLHSLVVASNAKSREDFVRLALTGTVIRERPPAEYGQIVRELRRIGSNIDAKHKALAIERAKLRNKLRRMHDSVQMQPIKAQISKLTDEMSKIRRDMRTCLDIAERHSVVEFVVNTIFTPEQRENENSLKRKERVKE